MSPTPRILVWHAHADDYRRALEARLPGVPIVAVHAADHDTGQSPAEDDETASLISDAEVLLAWKVPAGIVGRMHALRWLQVTGAGVDHFIERDDLPENLQVTRSLGRFGTQVAEYVIGYLLHHVLGIRKYREQQATHRWQRGDRPLLCDQTVGIIGLGSLGLPTAAALTALGARVLGVRRSAAAVDGVDEVFSAANWRSMLPQCDALVIAAPKTADTVGMVDAEAIAALPAGSILINVARGDIVDEQALLDALDSEHLGAAILDVFTVEPLPTDHPLWAHERAWITPHVAAPSEVDSIADEFADNYRRFIAGEALLNAIDRERGY